MTKMKQGLTRLLLLSSKIFLAGMMDFDANNYSRYT